MLGQSLKSDGQKNNERLPRKTDLHIFVSPPHIRSSVQPNRLVPLEIYLSLKFRVKDTRSLVQILCKLENIPLRPIRKKSRTVHMKITFFNVYSTSQGDRKVVFFSTDMFILTSQFIQYLRSHEFRHVRFLTPKFGGNSVFS